MPERAQLTQLCRQGRSGGFSLVELMVSVLLGIVLSLGIVSVYLESKRNYIAEEDTARIQENGRFALNYLKRELMQAGFYGGKLTVNQMPSVSVGTDCVASGNWALDANEPLEFINDYTTSLTTNKGTILNCLPAEIKSGTDIFTVKRSSGEPTLKNGVYKTGVTAATSNQWYLKFENYGDTKSWQNGSTAITGTEATEDSKVDFWEFYTQVFFIRNYSIASVDAIPTLCVARLVGSAMATDCLVEGVEDMQIEFGIDEDSDGTPNRFMDNPSDADITDAVVARIYLLLRGTSEIAGYTNDKTYNLGQKSITIDPDDKDRYLRRVMTTTVQMRNATLPSL
ncbi:MAG: hypothetical protein DRR42_11720 [Gammaproteobacteria bacterium]|nr:MAG: hypothetical protein DRR42_11720 [Gammaproteobacteria bacterium]